MTEKITAANISYPQNRQQWFPVCIFPLGQLDGLKGNCPQSASTGSLTVSGNTTKQNNDANNNNIFIDFTKWIILFWTKPWILKI